jgi:hypothetical protein
MSLELIQLYEAVPGLRTEHGSTPDNFLSSLMKASKTPWVIPHSLAEEITELCRADNLELAKLLSREQTSQMMEDARWWSANAYGEMDEIPPHAARTTN